MALFIEGQWTTPYEQFGPNNIRQSTFDHALIANLVLRAGLSNQESSQRLFEETMLPSLNDEGDGIDFDFAYASKDDPAKSEDGDTIYYPFGLPQQRDIELRTLIHPEKQVYAVKGHADLFAYRAVSTDRLVQLPEGEWAYPFKMIVQANKKNMTAYPGMTGDPDTGISAYYSSWEGSGREDFPGSLYVPRQLPKLISLKFRLQRVQNWEFDFIKGVRI